MVATEADGMPSCITVWRTLPHKKKNIAFTETSAKHAVCIVAMPTLFFLAVPTSAHYLLVFRKNTTRTCLSRCALRAHSAAFVLPAHSRRRAAPLSACSSTRASAVAASCSACLACDFRFPDTIRYDRTGHDQSIGAHHHDIRHGYHILFT